MNTAVLFGTIEHRVCGWRLVPGHESHLSETYESIMGGELMCLNRKLTGVLGSPTGPLSWCYTQFLPFDFYP